jgi:hypothetical protein
MGHSWQEKRTSHTKVRDATAISRLTNDYGDVKEEEMRNSAIASAITLLPLAL